LSNTIGSSNTAVGQRSLFANITGSNNTVIGHEADVGSDGLIFATAVGAQAVVSTSNTIQLGRANGGDGVRVPGTLVVEQLGSAGSTALCRNASNRLATCSSSARYKTSVRPFLSSLEVINRLHPVAFQWRADGMSDIGLVAEDVATVEPLLVTHNDKGEVEGVKYDRIGVLLLNTIKEQQVQIERQQKTVDDLRARDELLREELARQNQRIKEQQAQLEALRSWVCASTPKAAICTPGGTRK